MNPTSRQVLRALLTDGRLEALVAAGARIHQTGCNGCIGMGQAPAIGRNSLRTTPRNFRGRSGTEEDLVFLCSPETAAASALAGRIVDPRTLSTPYPKLVAPSASLSSQSLIEKPYALAEARRVKLVKGSNIHSLPQFDALPDALDLPILLKMGDNVSTDEILPAGAKVLPYRSNLQRIATFAFTRIDPSYPDRAHRERARGHAVMGGENYGQGSSREHAAAAPRYLGLRIVLAKSFARIHRQNLINYGVLPLRFADLSDYDRLGAGDVLRADNLRRSLEQGEPIVLRCDGREIETWHDLTTDQIETILEGGVVNRRRRDVA